MAVATTATLLPLDRFFRVAGIHPLHANQIVLGDIAPAVTCADPLLQYSWQDADRTGRDELADAIASVEARLIDYLNFSVRPVYYKNEAISFDPFASQVNYNVFNTPLGVGVGYLIAGGQQQKTVLGLAAAITYLDIDNDGYEETATVTTSNTDLDGHVITDPNDVSVYYPTKLAADEWEIRPISLSIDVVGGTITCTFKREQCVLPELMFGYTSSAIDGLDVSRFLSEVDVYHNWLDTTQTQLQFSWDPTWAYPIQTGLIIPTETKLGWGLLQPAHYDTMLQMWVGDNFVNCDLPSTVDVWFKAGWPLDNKGNMDGIWERCITYLTLAELDRPLCQCPTLATFTSYWAYDFALNTQTEVHQISRRKLDNPLGTTRAALYAWDQIIRYRLPDKE